MEEQIEKYMYYIVFLYSNSASAVTSESTVKIKKQTFPFWHTITSLSYPDTASIAMLVADDIHLFKEYCHTFSIPL